MMADSYTLEFAIRVYNDTSGDYVYVGPDVDGLDLIEIRYVENEKIHSGIYMPKEQARLVAEAINKVLNA